MDVSDKGEMQNVQFIQKQIKTPTPQFMLLNRI